MARNLLLFTLPGAVSDGPEASRRLHDVGQYVQACWMLTGQHRTVLVVDRSAYASEPHGPSCEGPLAPLRSDREMGTHPFLGHTHQEAKILGFG